VKLREILALAVGALLLASCVGRDPPTKERYVFVLDRSLAPSAAQVTGARTHGVLKVHRIRVSPLFDRKNFVYQTGESTFTEDFYREFYALPGVLLRLGAVDWFEDSPLFERVLRDTSARGADWVLEGEASRLFVDLYGPGAPQVEMRISFRLLEADDIRLRSVLEGTYSERCPLLNSSSQALATAWSSCLASVMSQLEIAVSRALPAG
jgi:ABC-type uncharacterized transport system auxiliary subunit